MPQRIYQNFFELQRHYKRNSMILYVLFVMAMMIHVLFALLFFMIIWYVILNVLNHYNKIIHDNEFLLKDIDVIRLFIDVSGVDLSVIDVDDFNDDKKRKRQRVIYAKDIKDFNPKYRRYYEFAEQLA